MIAYLFVYVCEIFFPLSLSLSPFSLLLLLLLLLLLFLSLKKGGVCFIFSIDVFI